MSVFDIAYFRTTYQQCPGVQARLVLWTIVVSPSQLQHCLVVPPQEEADCPLEYISHENVCPEFCAKNILRRKLHQRRNIIPLIVESGPSYNIDWNKNTTASKRQHQEDVSQHAHEPQKKNCIESNLVHQVLLFDLLDGRHPT